MNDTVRTVLNPPHPICDSMCNAHRNISRHANAGFSEQVKGFFRNIFSTSDWPARWHCGTWSDFHGWLYIISDLCTWASYFAIPFLLFKIVNKRRDIPFPRIIWLFIAFILLCGTTHLIDASIFWWPAYRISALVRFLTAVVSIFTVYALYRILPMIYNLRTQNELEAEIEERKKAEQEASYRLVMQQAAEELVIKKDEFMSIASHELKTPITSLKASLQLIERMTVKNEGMQDAAPFVAKAVKQVNKLTEIVHELMDVTRIQAGKLELVRTDFNLMDMIQECKELSQGENKHKVIILGDPKLTINADRNRLEQVLGNLLVNAFKYSPDTDPVNIDFDRLPDGRVKVEVTDHGIGIPADKIKSVFDRYYRVENTSQYFSGIGLGLYISAEIVKRHDGEIGVDSDESKGSTFWFIV